MGCLFGKDAVSKGKDLYSLRSCFSRCILQVHENLNTTRLEQ